MIIIHNAGETNCEMAVQFPGGWDIQATKWH